jgi:hypothetical protein
VAHPMWISWVSASTSFEVPSREALSPTLSAFTPVAAPLVSTEAMTKCLFQSELLNCEKFSLNTTCSVLGQPPPLVESRFGKLVRDVPTT